MGQPAKWDQDSFRGYADDGAEGSATPKAATNTNWSQDVDQNFRVRFLIQNYGGSNSSIDAQLQYNLNLAGWNNVTPSSSVLRSVLSPYFADGDPTTQQIGSGTFNTGEFDENSGVTGSISVPAGEETEVEFVVSIRSQDVADSDTLDLQCVKSGGGAYDAYTNSPSLTVVEAGATPKSASDTLLPMTSEASALEATLSVADSVLPRLDEATALSAFLATSDSLLVTLGEAIALLASFGVSDTLLPRIDEASAVLNAVVVNDTVLVTLGEAVALVASLDVADPLSIALSDVAALLADFALSDSLLPMLGETALVLNPLTAGDSILVSLTDAASLSAFLTPIDSLTPNLGEVADLAADLSASESLTPMLGELAAVLNLLAANDQILPMLGESSDVFQGGGPPPVEDTGKMAFVPESVRFALKDHRL